MPVVVVHGVGTRSSTTYKRRVAARSALVKRFLCGPLGLDGDRVTILNPYWGDVAATFAWQHASLPSPPTESLGPEDTAADPTATVLAEAFPHGMPPGQPLLADVASQSLPDAVDLLWSSATAIGRADDRDLSALAAAADRILAWGEQTPGATEDLADDDEMLRRVFTVLHDDGGDDEWFGASDVFSLLREGASRLRTYGPRLSSEATVSLIRGRLHNAAANFLGDVLTYQRQRERDGDDGAIAGVVAEELAAATSARTNADPRVIVIAHSMGGNIVYDLLSSPDYTHRELKCDLLVTVGSQVGLFAELGMFPAIDPPRNHHLDRAARPARVGRWINVFDRCDLLSFAAEGIFDGVEDYEYSTGVGMLRSHSTYFNRPSFFRRLAVKAGEGH